MYVYAEINVLVLHIAMLLDNLAVCSVYSVGWDSQIRGMKVLGHAIVYVVTIYISAALVDGLS